MSDAEGEMNHNQPRVRIQMLGGFQLQCGNSLIGENSGRSYQMWNLLEYLIVHRHQEVSQAMIIEALWPDESSDNPANALKNLVYRIRTALTAAGFAQGKEMVKYESGSYFFNNAVDPVVDAEEFERLYKEATLPGTPRDRQEELLTRAIALYKGDFLPRSQHEPWVVSLSTYYHGLYLRSVLGLVTLLKIQDRQEDIINLCERALLVDQFEEALHEELIRALIAQNKQKKALDHYQHTTDLFYRTLGVKPSESLRSLYREIVKTVNMVETDLEIIKEDLRESSRSQGAFLCDYEIFRSMYQLEVRTAARSGQAVFLGLLTLSPVGDHLPEQKLFITAMDRLREALCGSLRLGDVVSRFSASQYVLMLPTLTYENGQMVMARVAKKFAALYRGNGVRLTTTLLPLDSIL